MKLKRIKALASVIVLLAPYTFSLTTQAQVLTELMAPDVMEVRNGQLHLTNYLLAEYPDGRHYRILVKGQVATNDALFRKHSRSSFLKAYQTMAFHFLQELMQQRANAQPALNNIHGMRGTPSLLVVMTVTQQEVSVQVTPAGGATENHVVEWSEAQ